MLGASHLTRHGTAAGELSGTFAGKTVALLLWGDAFRPSTAHWNGGSTNCVQSSFEAQREATASQRERIVRPLKRAGARMQVLFTFPLCDQRNLTQPLHDVLVEWLGRANVVQTAFVEDAGSLEESMRAAWQLLWRRVVARGVYDYTLLMRHDIYQQHSFDAWPPSTVLRPMRGHNLTSSLFRHMHMLPRRTHAYERVLFEAPCRGCGNSCNCGLGYKLDLDCGLCTNDHMLWVPARHLEHVAIAANTSYWSGHQFYRRVTPLVPDRDIGFLFPPSCDDSFCNFLISNQYQAYRPVRTLFG